MKIVDVGSDKLMKIAHQWSPGALGRDSRLLTLCTRIVFLSLWASGAGHARGPLAQSAKHLDLLSVTCHTISTGGDNCALWSFRKLQDWHQPIEMERQSGRGSNYFAIPANMRDKAGSKRLLSRNVLLYRWHIDYSAIPLRAGRTRICGAI
jgi:hypothetical protein